MDKDLKKKGLIIAIVAVMAIIAGYLFHRWAKNRFNK